MLTTPLHIDHIPSVLFGETSRKLFLYVHGKYSHKHEAADFAQIATRKGYQVLSFDLPEHGDRKAEASPCTVQNGVRDLRTVYEHIRGTYDHISLFACSLGAYFSLVAYRDVRFETCLFLSPLLDMERLILNMMTWSNVDEERLRAEREIPTTFGETLSWDYYEYVKTHPITQWESPTSILYGEDDNITERNVLDSFVSRFGCRVEVMEKGEHHFHTPEQLAVLNNWLENQIRG